MTRFPMPATIAPMKSPRFIRILLTGLLLFASPLPIVAAEAEEIPWYDVELIVFVHNSEEAGQSEAWPDDPGTPDWYHTRRLKSAQAAKAGKAPTDGVQPRTPDEAVAENLAAEPIPFAILPQEEWKLLTEAHRLRLTGGRMEPLLHLAWRQPIEKEKPPERIYLQSSETRDADSPTQPRLQGVVGVSLKRYLHLDLDLLLHNPSSPFGAGIETTLTADRSGYINNLKPWRYRLQATRRMRSGDLHYIDHPVLGVIAKITSYERPEPPEEEIVELPVEATGEAPAAAPSNGEEGSQPAAPATPAIPETAITPPR